jgi:hypothetical protein
VDAALFADFMAAGNIIRIAGGIPETIDSALTFLGSAPACP